MIFQAVTLTFNASRRDEQHRCVTRHTWNYVIFFFSSWQYLCILWTREWEKWDVNANWLNWTQICKRKSNLNSIERCNSNSNNKNQSRNKFKDRNSNSIQIQSTRKYKLMTNWIVKKISRKHVEKHFSRDKEKHKLLKIHFFLIKIEAFSFI